MLAARAVATGAPAYTESFPRERETVSRARKLTRLSLDTWGLEVLTDNAVLICSELVTNAVAHATSSRLRLTVTRLGEKSIRIAVVDRSRRGPSRRLHVATEDEHGRGLVLVEELSTRWGVDFMRWGKRVWADLDVP
jgi:two-component sensor histidine kinase